MTAAHADSSRRRGRELLRGLGIAGFSFFLLKGLVWLTLLALVYLGVG